MMENQPLNLLTSANQAASSSANLTRPATSGANTNNQEQRQMALSSIFNSLSSLAASSTSQLHEQAGQPAEVQQTLQSVMAAAMLQQQHQIHHQDPAKTLLAPEQFNIYSHVDMVGTNQQPQQQQRINYCTICNKELCNKYFMKTHMIKMHGINLEMEPTDEDQDEQDKREAESDSERDQTNSPDNKSLLNFSNQDQQQQSSNSFDDSTTNIKQQNKSSVKQAANQKKNQPQYSNSTPKKKPPTTSANQGNKQTTSVLNGFAGNSMGGVVCDICNKELCSKYFLKVHKQNTHGIADYPDATNQFAMYPFPSSIAGSNPFLPTAAPPTMSQSFGSFGMPNVNPMNIFSTLNNQTEELSSSMSDCSHEKTNNAKKPRLSKQSNAHSSINIDRKDECLNFNSVSENSSKQQMDSVYRLLIAQQQQQQQQQHQQQHLGTPIPSAPATSLMPPMDPMAAAALSAVNPLSALMCFGAVGPLGSFAPPGMSPATIVDNILRNQHLFNRNNNNNNQPPNVSSSNHQSITNLKGADGNNNSDSNHNNPKSSKETSSNSRYFSHYTEACPMCDRRFKSIKWLKTHMMNDHKQEIGAYMQMMMQYLYTSKTQQMAAAATMAAFEQQQQQQQQHNLNMNQQNLIRHLNDHNVPHQEFLSAQANNLTNHKYRNLLEPFQMQQQSQNNNAAMALKQFQLRQGYQYPNGGNSPENMSAQLNYINEQQRILSIDARSRDDSISPDESDTKRSPSTSTLRPAHSSVNKQLVLNFDLSKSKQRQIRQDDDPLLSELTQNDSNDSVEDLSRDSNIDREDDNQRIARGSPAESKPNIEQGAANHLSIKTTSSSN